MQKATMELRNSGLVLTLLLVLFTPPIFAKSSKDLGIQIYEVDERNAVQRVLETKPGATVILDRVNRIRLECNAPFPVQWIYSGNGVPTLSSTIRKESDQKFMASAFITSLKESHSGRYECFSTESPQEASAYFFVYVPGPNIFTASDGGSNEKKKLQISKNDTIIRIPCAVSNPEVSVVLEKSAGEVLVAIKSLGTTPAYSFDPQIGFSLDIRLIQNPEGVYVCTAFGRGSKKTIEFEVSSKLRDTSGYFPTHEPIIDKKGVFRCSTHTDCPPDWSCYTDLQCRDPCLNSIRCGSGAVCKYNDRRPYCECPTDFVGDPMRECFNTLQGSEGGFQNTPRPNIRPNQEPPATKPPTSSGNQCKVDGHCSQTHICVNGNCLDACSLKICHRNAYCVTDRNRIARCECNPGFAIQNGYDCTPIKIQVEPISRDVQGDAPPRSETGSSSSRNSNKKSCAHNQDCPANQICKIASTHAPFCTELCGSRLCGENAKCEDGFCLCKPNFAGDPFTVCTEERKLITPVTRPPKKEFDDCLSDSDCADKQKCQALSSYRTCVDACLTTRCPYNTECQAIGHNGVCTCPKGFTGSTQFGCTRAVVVDTSSEFKRQRDSPRNLQITKLEVSTQSSTLIPNCSKPNLDCGPNSECRIIEGEETCFCQSNFIGEPPNCKHECTFNIECPASQTCVRNRCRNACNRNKCGKNAVCRVSTGASRTHNCSCREGFEGNPESSSGCFPIRDHK